MIIKKDLIERYDRSNMLEVIANFGQQCREAYRIGMDVELPSIYREARNVVISGMGGSAIGGDLIRCVLNRYTAIPITVNRNYGVPEFVNQTTLFVGSSYSGNTEETLEAFEEALGRGAMCVAITSGGEIRKLAEEAMAPVIVIPPGLQPRCALGYMCIPTLAVLWRLGFAPNFDLTSELEETISVMEEIADELSPDKPNNPAVATAEKLAGKIPVIYSSFDLEVAAVRWRGQISENAKSLASSNSVPEMNHNEIEGWKNPAEILDKIAVIWLRDDGDHERVRARMDITSKLIAEYPASVTEVKARGHGILARLLSLMYFADYVAFYLALLYGEDPTPVDRIAALKRELAQL